MEEIQQEVIEQEVVDGEEQRGLRMPSTRDIGLLLLGGGAVGALVARLRKDRHLGDWALPVCLAAAGVALLVKRRESEMKDAQEAILSELDQLDPIAKAQVLKAVGQNLIGR